MAQARKEIDSGLFAGRPRTGTRPLAVILVFALLVSLFLVILPASRALAVTETYYLKGTRVPKADLSTAVPTSGTLPNFDPGQDSDPGRKLDKSGDGWNEGNSSKYQLWVAAQGTQEINGPVSLTFWSAMKDFKDDKSGHVEAFLLDCSPGGSGCVLIDQVSTESDPWSASGSWVSSTIDFGSVTHTISETRSLAVKVVVAGDSDDDMWFAYDTTSYPSRLSFQTVVPTTTTTTITAAPTTTDPAVSPTAPAPTTTVAVAIPPIVETTTTTTLEAGGSSTTPAVAAPSGQGSGPSGDPSSVIEAAGPAPPSGAANSTFGGFADPGLATMGVGDESLTVPLTRTSSWTDSVIKGLELVMPPWAASMVTSPLMILGFVVEAMTDSGKAIMLPFGLLMAGMLWVVFENRGSGFALMRSADDEGDY